MKDFTLTEVQKMRIEVQKALQDIAAKYDAQIEVGKIKYGSSVNMQLEFAKLTSNENGAYALTKEAQEFNSRARGLGLNKDVLGEKILHRKETYIITGYNTRRSRYPISYTKNGRSFKCTVQGMKEFVKSGRPEFFL